MRQAQAPRSSRGCKGTALADHVEARAPHRLRHSREIAGLAPGTSRNEIGRAVSPAGPIECSPAVTATTPSTDSSKGQDQWPDTGPCAIL